VRTGVVALALAVLVLVPVRSARAQFTFDARRVGMGGVSLSRDGNVQRYNPAYRAVKNRGKVTGAPRFAIPIPLGLIQFFKDHPINQLGDDPLFNPDSVRFNPFELANLIFNPPIFYEVRKAPTPTNDVEFTVGKNQLILNLGASKVLIPEQSFGIGSTSRLLDAGFGFAGFNIGVMGFLQYDAAFTVDTALRRALTNDTIGVLPNDTLPLLTDVIVQAGLAPSVGYAGRILRGAGGDESDDGLYIGGAIHYYLGGYYARGTGPVELQVGDPIFGATPTIQADGQLRTATPYGHGVGGDVGIVWISGPFEIGLGANDIGAELTWSKTKVQQIFYDVVTNSFSSTVLLTNVETKTKLPITYIANAALRMGTGTTVGADVVNSGRGAVIHVGAEQRTGPFAVRGGVSRDQRRKMQFGFGGGLKFGSIGLDAGLWTHSNSFATKRGITLATSISIY
jgi:hypothetical protein